MMSDHLYEKLSDYVDGELAGDELAAAETHLASCAECRAEVEGLRRLVRRAKAMDDRLPEQDLWSGIAARLNTPATSDVVPLDSRRRRFAFTMPQLAAAAVLLVTISIGAARLMMTGTPALRQSGGPEMRAIPASNAGDATVASYDSAITGMQQLLHNRRGQLDTATVRVVEQSLAVIDAAIRQAREALNRDPANLYLNGQLQRTLGAKLDVLRHAATLPTAI